MTAETDSATPTTPQKWVEKFQDAGYQQYVKGRVAQGYVVSHGYKVPEAEADPNNITKRPPPPEAPGSRKKRKGAKDTPAASTAPKAAKVTNVRQIDFASLDIDELIWVQEQAEKRLKALRDRLNQMFHDTSAK